MEEWVEEGGEDGWEVGACEGVDFKEEERSEGQVTPLPGNVCLAGKSRRDVGLGEEGVAYESSPLQISRHAKQDHEDS